MCNSCGDKFTANELGPLVAPGAAHPNKDTTGQDPANGEETAVTDKPVLSAGAPIVEGETNSLIPTSTNNDPGAGPALSRTDTSTGAGTPLPPQSSATPSASTPALVDTAPVTSDNAPGSLENPQAAVPISSTDHQDSVPPPIAEATSMDLDQSADRPSTGEPDTS